jgi:hypothetical protein
VPADRTDPRSAGGLPPSGSSRRSVVPPAAGRSLWLAAAWTGAGTALIGAVLGIVAVAICWLPASGSAGNASSAIRAGVLTFLAALHGGITVDGVAAELVPLGLTVLVGVLAWRAGTGLADVSDEHHDPRPATLAQAGILQAVVFALVCGLAAHFAPLGTRRVSPLAAAGSGLLLFAASGTVSFVRASALREPVAAWLAGRPAAALRAGAAVAVVYLAAGALLVAASLVLHRGRAELLSAQVGGGWSGVPVLVLGALAAPNAAIAGASYLAGPGFALGTGSSVSLGSTVHGTLPAFPVLGAVPTGPANPAAWLLAAATPVAAGLALVRIVRAAPAWRERWLQAALGVAVAAVLGAVLGWLGGGGIGSGRLSTVGASPWQLGLAVAAGAAAVGTAALAGLAAVSWWRGRVDDRVPVGRAPLTAVAAPESDRGARPGDAEGADQLAG